MIKRKWLEWLLPERLSILLLKIFLLTFPLQLQTMLYRTDFFSGQFNYFTTAFLQFSEIVLLLALFFWGVAILMKRVNMAGAGFAAGWLEISLTGFVSALVVWNLLSVFWAGDKVMALLMAFKWLELTGLLIILIYGGLARADILRFLFFGALFQVALAVSQYFKQEDLGLQWLGEPRLGADYLNIARMELGGEKILRGYGTFAHANILGGYLFFCLALWIMDYRRELLFTRIPFLIVFLLGLLISFSRGAWLATGVFFFMLMIFGAAKITWKQLLFSLVMLLFVLAVFGLDQVILGRIADFSGQAWQERLLYSDIARQMILFNPLFGVGAGNFVLEMQSNYAGVLNPWLYQPVHNVGMMILAETGVMGILLWLGVLVTAVKMILATLRRVVMAKKLPGRAYLAMFFGLLALTLLDHYLYSVWAGQVLFFLLLAMIAIDYRAHRHVLLQ